MSGFRRLVLELGHGAADPEMMRQAAAFAQLLKAELHALFVEDEMLLHAGGLPFAREISSLSMRWRKLAPDQLETDLRIEAGQARRHLTEAARAHGVTHHFEVRRGDVSLHVTETCVAGDIVVISSPRGPGAETAHGFLRLRETACTGVASVLFLPPNAGRPHGPVVAVVSGDGDGDPSLAVARWIAEQEKERLVVLTMAGRGSAPATLVQDIAANLGATRERLIVLTRDVGEAAGLSVARGVPVLMIEPEAAITNRS